MEHRQETDLGSEMLGIEGNLEKSFGAGLKQQVVEALLVLQHEWRELVGQGKDHVKVVDREQFFLASREPMVTSCDQAWDSSVGRLFLWPFGNPAQTFAASARLRCA